MEGWVLRTSSGYTKRANSVNPLYGAQASIDEIAGRIERAERYYLDAGLKPVFKITPYVQPIELDEFLADRGYGIVEPSSVRVRNLDNLAVADHRYSITVGDELSEEWLDVFAELGGLSLEQQNTLRRMLQSSNLLQGFAILRNEGVPASCGLGVIQHGYIGLYDIITAPSQRRQGMAEQMLLGLLGWGKNRGATDSFLQVVQANRGASALYDKLGFKEIYQYWYRVKNKYV